jgi:hypothetical protein
MKPEFINALLVLVYLAGGTIGITLLVGWALKRFGSPGQPSSKMPAPESKDQDWRKAGGASIPRSSRETARQQ